MIKIRVNIFYACITEMRTDAAIVADAFGRKDHKKLSIIITFRAQFACNQDDDDDAANLGESRSICCSCSRSARIFAS